MIIKEVGVGNEKEAFVEKRFSSGVNLIFSNENNKGKTVLFQGLMYSLGNSPVFPEGFNHEDCYFYSKIEVVGKEFEFLRKNDVIVIKSAESIQVCSNMSELKYFFNKNILPLPIIQKDGMAKIVDLMLLYQIFFVGQDKRDPSNIANLGYYNKIDFANMIYSLGGCGSVPELGENIKDIREKVADLNQKLKDTKKLISLVKTNRQVANFTLNSSDKIEFEQKTKDLQMIHAKISDLKKTRERELNRKLKLDNLLGELKSLNQEISVGELKCADCGSKNIIYSADTVEFAISNLQVRQKIILSIEEQIAMKAEMLDEFTRNINKEQDKLKLSLAGTPHSFKNLILNSDAITSSTDSDEQVLKLQQEIADLKEKLYVNKSESESIRKSRIELKTKILSVMMDVYKKIDPQGNLVFEDLFAKSGHTYSGSEEQEFYYARLIAFNSVLNHIFPIIIDSFRGGELSSRKDELMITQLSQLNKQIILSATLKDEEYAKLKYLANKELNILDYSTNANSKMLTPNHSPEFMLIIKSFGIVL